MVFTRLKIVLILSLFVFALMGQYYALRINAEKQWETESKLYTQGYLDGKQEVLDSLKSITND